MANSNIESRARQTERVFREIIDKDRAAVEAKTEKLRALRLAREAESDAAPAPAAKPAKVTKRKKAS